MRALGIVGLVLTGCGGDGKTIGFGSADNGLGKVIARTVDAAFVSAPWSLRM